ncbi:MAG: sigma-54 dependent transcriptional regulator [Bacteroidales bacterium]|nr:sigma-54 dependent transcriptional regulator [Bacteroidales bacterium]
MRKTGKILVVDDNAGIRTALKILLPMHFAEVELIPSPKELMTKARSFMPDAILLDMNFHTDINTGNEGLFWLSEIKREFPETNVVLFTAYADISLAVEGMKRGAFDFIVKPWENEQLTAILKSAAAGNRKQAKKIRKAAENMVWGESDSITAIRRTVEKIADTDASVLITGENGTGKDMLAGEIHRLSGRSGKEMTSVDAGAIPESLFESELFGHAKGSFTDAHSDKEGKFESADGSTLFLDEIGNIPLHLQAKLLRALQNRSVTRIGETKSREVDIRLICATNMDLEKMVADGRFREDLFYRLNTVPIKLPPLRERRDEIKGLAEIFLRRYADKYHRNVTGLSKDAVRLLESCTWPGNIRELQNTMERAVIMSDKEILDREDFNIVQDGQTAVKWNETSEYDGIETLDAAEERAIRVAMDKYSGNLSLVAKALEISRPTLYSKLKKYGI